jgi:cyclophilin family peptidyl-prolyl cis-trans isomerase
VHRFHKSLLALSAFIALMALAGCQKGGDSTQPAANVPEPNSAKMETSEASKAASTVKSDQDPQHPVYEVMTTRGKVIVRLDAEKAPLTVDNFRNYVARGFYNLTIFHQVFNKGVQIVVGGGYTADLKEKSPFTPIRNEAHNGLKNHRGTVAMLRRDNDEDSATCQFFINVADNDSLNFKSRSAAGYGYCVFGEVTEGMEIFDGIAKGPTQDTGNFHGMPADKVVIQSIRQIK